MLIELVVKSCLTALRAAPEQMSIPLIKFPYSRRSRLRSVSVDDIQKSLNVSESNLTRTKSFETSFKEKRSKTASPEIKVDDTDGCIDFIKPKRPRFNFSTKLIDSLDSDLKPESD